MWGSMVLGLVWQYIHTDCHAESQYDEFPSVLATFPDEKILMGFWKLAATSRPILPESPGSKLDKV